MERLSSLIMSSFKKYVLFRCVRMKRSILTTSVARPGLKAFDLRRQCEPGLTQYADAVLWASNSPSPRKSNNHNNCSILLCRTTSFRRVCCSNKDREYSVGALFSRAVPLGTPVVSKTSACFKSAAAVRKKIFFLLLPIEFIFHMNVMDTWMDCILLFYFLFSGIAKSFKHTHKKGKTRF